MIRTFSKTLAIIVLSATAFTACKKDSDNSDSKEETLAVSETNLLGTYTLVSFTADGQDAMANYLENCQKDDEYVLKANNVFELNDAGTACDPNGSYDDQWSLQANKVTFDLYEGNIDKLTNKTLVVTKTYTWNNITTHLTATFARK